MVNLEYGYKKRSKWDYNKSINKCREELSKEGFGVLTEIDVKATLKKKLNIDYDNYMILGACNPPFAHRALETEKEVGLMLPCNVIVYEKGDNIFVSAILPTIAMNMIDNPDLKKIAEEVETKLKRVIDNI